MYVYKTWGLASLVALTLVTTSSSAQAQFGWGWGLPAGNCASGNCSNNTGNGAGYYSQPTTSYRYPSTPGYSTYYDNGSTGYTNSNCPGGVCNTNRNCPNGNCGPSTTWDPNRATVPTTSNRDWYQTNGILRGDVGYGSRDYGYSNVMNSRYNNSNMAPRNRNTYEDDYDYSPAVRPNRVSPVRYREEADDYEYDNYRNRDSYSAPTNRDNSGYWSRPTSRPVNNNPYFD